jgi:hypothetical protein
MLMSVARAGDGLSGIFSFINTFLLRRTGKDRSNKDQTYKNIEFMNPVLLHLIGIEYKCMQKP